MWRGTLVKKEEKEERERERKREATVSPSTMGKIFSLMNQDECTPVPITLQPRSPYFALLDFCHFKASGTSGRTEERGREKMGELPGTDLPSDRC